MTAKRKSRAILRWWLSALVILAGLSATWAWGQVARLAEADPEAAGPQEASLYAIWQTEGSRAPGLYRSADGGQNWELLRLPAAVLPRTTVQPASLSGASQLAVVTDDGVLVSNDAGDTWATTIQGLEVLSLAWAADGSLYLGTDGQGIYRLPAGGAEAVPVSTSAPGPAAAAVTQLAVAPSGTSGEGRLFASNIDRLYYSDDGGSSWQRTAPIEDWISTLAAVDADQVYVGTETLGVFRSLDAGRSWQPAREGLGLAAGQAVRVTALSADPRQAGVLYAAVDHVLGGTQVHASAAGAFVSLNDGTSWQPLVGPGFPAAQHASSLVLLIDRPLYVEVVTAGGRQSYAPDIAAAMAALNSPEAPARVAAARLLGLARASEASQALLAALTDADPSVSLAAGRALGEIADPTTAGPLLVALEHPALEVRLGAARALGMMGAGSAVEPLRAMLLQGEGQEISVAADALAQIGSPAAIDALLVPLEDLTLTARRHAALGALEGLGELAVAPLVLQLGNPSGHIRRNAAEALGWIAAPSAADPLLQAVQRDGDPEVRAQAAWALGEIGNPAALATLARVAASDPAVRVRNAAEQALPGLADQPGGQQSQVAGWLASRWITSVAQTLSHLQPLRWLVLALTLAAAGWLASGQVRLPPRANPKGRMHS